MSSNPRISFTKPGQNQSNVQPVNPYYQNNPNIPPNHQSNFYEVRQTNVLQSNTSPVDLSQKPATIFVARAPPVQEVPRPQYDQTYNKSAQSKRLGPPNDPVPRLTCCTPIWWYIAALLGVTGLILSLLFGLNVIGGGPAASQKVASARVAPTTTKTSQTTATTYNTLPYGAPTLTPSTLTNANKPYTAGTFMPATIPAQTVVTTTTTSTSHHQVSKPQNSIPTVVVSPPHRHRLSVDQDQQDN